MMKCQRNKFLLQRKNAFFNCAYMAPLMKKVEKAGISGIKQKRNPAKISGEDFFRESDALRMNFSRLINNDQPDRVVIIPSVSYGMANVANNLPFNSGEIIVLDKQFPSNVYPWTKLKEQGFEIKFIEAPASANRGEDWNSEILAAINEETRVVALGHVHWADGTLFALEKIREKLDQVGGLLVIDGTQSVGALPFDVQRIRPDALVVAGYKWLMGPYSIGLAYYGSAFDGGNPIEENWINRVDSDNFSNLVNYQPEYRPHALRYEVGEHSNFILVPMLNTAIKQLMKWEVTNIQDYTKTLMENAVQELTEAGYKIEDKQWRAHHLFGIRLPEQLSLDVVKESLVRSRVQVSYRGDSVRIAPHVYNDEMDVRKLVRALKAPIFA